MNTPAFYAIVSTFIVSLISFVGILTLTFKRQWLDKTLVLLISLSAGTLLGDSFIHLLPEAIEASGELSLGISLLVLSGILGFFILEKFILWHHHHSIETPEDHEKNHHTHEICDHKTLRAMNFLGDTFHNLLDGMIIAASFLVDPIVGLSTTLAVILHEIPQEIGDFGIFIHTGFTPKRALLLNFLSGIFAVLGAVFVLLAGKYSESFIQALIPLTAGAFIYIGASDLIPELKKTKSPVSSLFQFFALLLGIFAMIALLFLE